ncbi:tRNA (guanine(9)-N1)-methyltransferase isoform X2 [Salvia miltiorrhiza]|uniref:tRNA (guanine(9)-N1)-methyltransferase isoform X1 n=1 Tax=Salvia miltiorrhiza TaxID=226208 RepID=UPI0025AD7535|nr:tRNA (guanine(9)-N1)-methyltransferase isoform X1 [Salvia miltiorrhiza]XP_057765092.1 tRNA (guanine(9)-N1)-methyltransferase isoform X2 [Salvia miltiorrhiza]
MLLIFRRRMVSCYQIAASGPCGNWKTSIRRPLPPQQRLHFPLPASRLTQLRTTLTPYLQMEPAMEPLQNDQTAPPAAAALPMSKNAQKRLLKQQRFEAKKAEKKAQMKEHKKREAERKRTEWAEKLASLGDEEREKLIEQRKGMRRERMEKRSEEKGQKLERLQQARVNGQNVVIDLEFAHLMTSTELSSLVQQIMYCYAINGRCALPAHIWLTGCKGEMQNQLMRIPGYDRWLIEKEDQSYIEAFQDQKENLVYLTADSENSLDELDLKSIYIIGGLVDRNRWKGLTMNKANEQGIKTAKLPIGSYLKMSSSQVLTVNQVVEILLKFLESRDWKHSFFQVIPLRKRGEAGSEDSTVTLKATVDGPALGESLKKFIGAAPKKPCWWGM